VSDAKLKELAAAKKALLGTMIVIEKIFGRAARLDLGNKLLFFIFLHSS